jgi:hypothetical protein
MTRVPALTSLILAACGLTAAAAQQPNPNSRTHWEDYRTLSGEVVDQYLTDPILRGAVDLHAHYGPDVYPRYADAFEVAQLAADRGLRAIVIKNHFTESSGIAQLIRTHGAQRIEVFGGVAMNTTLGGVNPEAVRYMVDSSNGIGRIVWLPTHDSVYEVIYNGQTRPSVRVSDDDGVLLPEVLDVLDLIAEHDLTLATGHITGAEILAVIAEAKARGVERIIVTHPMLGGQYTNITVPELEKAAAQGGMVELVASEFATPEGAAEVVETIRLLGPEHCFISSDSGLVARPNHTDALVLAIRALREAGFDEDELSLMFRENPARLIGLEPL